MSQFMTSKLHTPSLKSTLGLAAGADNNTRTEHPVRTCTPAERPAHPHFRPDRHALCQLACLPSLEV